MDDIPYEKRRNSRLPWGYWLEATGDPNKRRALRDEEGRYWSSVREYLWCDRLNMKAPNNIETMHDQLEFLLAVLVAMERRIVPIEEAVDDLFHSWEQARFYGDWLSSLGIGVPMNDRDIFDHVPTEGQAIVVMLASTRRSADVPLAIGLPTLDAHRGLDPAALTPEHDAAIAELEAFADRLDFRFSCTRIGREYAIKLVGDALGPNVPLRRTLWTLAFNDRYARDRFYLWLHHRVDRWNDWGQLAHRKGARALSERLLQLQFSDQIINQPERDSPSS